MALGPITVPSGLMFTDPPGRLLAFCAEEYDYYDAILSGDPDRIEPLDVLATVSMNSFVNTADRVRSVHRGLAAACDPILATIPEDADLLDRGLLWDNLDEFTGETLLPIRRQARRKRFTPRPADPTASPG